VGKIYNDDGIDETCNGVDIYGVLAVQHQLPNLPQLTNNLQLEQLVLPIPQTLAVFELLFGVMLWLPQIQGNWVTVKY
jgi:hypothetical protein